MAARLPTEIILHILDLAAHAAHAALSDCENGPTIDASESHALSAFNIALINTASFRQVLTALATLSADLQIRNYQTKLYDDDHRRKHSSSVPGICRECLDVQMRNMAEVKMKFWLGKVKRDMLGFVHAKESYKPRVWNPEVNPPGDTASDM